MALLSSSIQWWKPQDRLLPENRWRTNRIFSPFGPSMYLEACLFTKYVASLLSIKKKTSKTLADFTAIGVFGLTAMCFHVNVLDTCHGTTTSIATTAGGTVFDLAPCMQVWGFCFCLYSAFRRALAPNPLNIANACYHIFLASASAASSKFSRSKSTGAADRFWASNKTNQLRTINHYNIYIHINNYIYKINWEGCPTRTPNMLFSYIRFSRGDTTSM